MTSTSQGGMAVGHPAPERHKAHPLALLFGLLGGPAAWLTQLLFAFATTSYFCFAPLPLAAWMHPALITLNLLALATGTAALLVAGNLLRLTRHEHDGAARSVVDAGEGRTRFLAVWGVFASAVFIVATLANTPSLFLVSLCKL